MSNLSFQYPLPYIFLAVLVALTLTALLYYRNNRQKEIPLLYQSLLGALRFLAVFLICILLMSPLLKQTETQTVRPVIMFAMDNSASISAVADSTTRSKWISDWKQLQQNLSSEYDVRSFQFGDFIKDDPDYTFDDKSTNLGAVFEAAYNKFGAENLSAVVLLSDGIYNEGRDPAYALGNLKVPVYTVMVGDTTQRKDLKIKKIFHNKIAYLGDKFRVQVDISAYNLMGKNTKLTITEQQGGSFVKRSEVNVDINKDDFFKTIEVELEAKEAGVRRFRFSLSPVEGEFTTANNSREIFIEVLDGRQKILILALSPHPDVAAIRQLLELNQNVEVEHSLLRDFKKNIKEFNLVVLHQLPGKGQNVRPLLKQMDEASIPRLFIIGSQSDLNVFNTVQNALKISSNVSRPNEVQPKLTNNFNLFTLEERTKSKIGQFVPLAAPFGDYTLGTGVEVLLTQRIGQVDTDYPLLLFQNTGNAKMAALLGEGFYRWRFFDFLQHENTSIADEILQKTITYLNVKEDKRRFRAYASKNVFEENEPLIFGAELYNESYELINEPDAHLVLINEDEQEFPFVFNKRGNAYYLEPGQFPTGQYRFKSHTDFGGKRLEYSGQFSIQPIEKELFDLTADHGLLRRLSKNYNGASFYPEDLKQIESAIVSNRVIRSLIFESTSVKPGIDLKWVFFILVLLLALEWFFRKFLGSY